MQSLQYYSQYKCGQTCSFALTSSKVSRKSERNINSSSQTHQVKKNDNREGGLDTRS